MYKCQDQAYKTLIGSNLPCSECCSSSCIEGNKAAAFFSWLTHPHGMLLPRNINWKWLFITYQTTQRFLYDNVGLTDVEDLAILLYIPGAHPPTSCSHRDAIAPNYESDTTLGNLLVSFIMSSCGEKMSDDIDDHTKQITKYTRWYQMASRRSDEVQIGCTISTRIVISQYHRAFFFDMLKMFRPLNMLLTKPDLLMPLSHYDHESQE